MSNVRLIRLQRDYEEIMQEFTDHEKIKVQSFGNPPERYVVTYLIKGITKLNSGDQPVYSNNHKVEIYLPINYPRECKCTPQTSIFHPNFSSFICIGKWTPGESLVDLIYRIGEMIQYKDYNLRDSFRNEAHNWVERNASMLPIDNTDLRDKGLNEIDIVLHRQEPEVDIILYEAESNDLEIELKDAD